MLKVWHNKGDSTYRKLSKALRPENMDHLTEMKRVSETVCSSVVSNSCGYGPSSREVMFSWQEQVCFKLHCFFTQVSNLISYNWVKGVIMKGPLQPSVLCAPLFCLGSRSPAMKTQSSKQ